MAESLVRIFCEATGLKRPDRSQKENITQSRELINSLVEKMGAQIATTEGQAIKYAEGLIKRIVKYGSDRGPDKTNLTHIGYLVRHLNRLMNEYGLRYNFQEKWWGFDDPV
jgi:hypothetical protein